MDAYLRHLADRLPETLQTSQRRIPVRHPSLIYTEGMYVIDVTNQPDNVTMDILQDISETFQTEEVFVIIIQHARTYKDYRKPYYQWVKAKKRPPNSYSYSETLVHLHTLPMWNPNSPVVTRGHPRSQAPKFQFMPYSWVSTFHYMPRSNSISPSPIYYTEKHPDKDTPGALMEYKNCSLYEWTCVGCQSKGLVGPLCKKCTEKEAGVRVQPATYGCGLFAIQGFEQNDIIVPYMGDDSNKPSNIYSVTLRPRKKDTTEKTVDAACKRSTAAFINHANTPNVELNDIGKMFVCGVDTERGRIQCIDNDLDIPVMMTIPCSLLEFWFSDKEGLWIVAKTNINPNTELMLDYGRKSYWKNLDARVQYDTRTATVDGTVGDVVQMCCSQRRNCMCYQCRINHPLTTSAARSLQPPNTSTTYVSESDDEVIEVRSSGSESERSPLSLREQRPKRKRAISSYRY